MAIRLIILIIVFTFNFSCIDKDKTIYTAYDHPQIVYSGYQWWNYDIISVDIFGNDFSHITKNEWADTGPIVSPDGSQLIFASDRDGNREIYSMNIAFVGGYYNWVGENLKNISQDPYFDGDYSFSPDGEKILYLKYYPENDNYDIFLMNNDGSDKKNISNTPWYEKKPMFSPDGTNIIYQSWQYNNVEIFDLIRSWADERGIYKEGDPKTQLIKLYEETGELAKALLEGDKNGIIDAIGDSVVVLTNLSKLVGYDIESCIQSAYDEIFNRTGRMVDGTFVKDTL